MEGTVDVHAHMKIRARGEGQLHQWADLTVLHVVTIVVLHVVGVEIVEPVCVGVSVGVGVGDHRFDTSLACTI